MKKILKAVSQNFLVLLLLLSCSPKKKLVDPLENSTPEQLYSLGEKKINKQEFEDSIVFFERINQEFPYSPLAGKAQIMEAYAYYKRAKFEQAIAAIDDYIMLYPGDKNIAYAYYLKCLCYYDQISEIKLDQDATYKAKDSFIELINRFPETSYARDGKFKLVLVLDHLAGKEIAIGRYYLGQGEIISAINRFKIVVENYQTTSQIEEALYRLVECYHILGVNSEAQKYAAVLGNNYPESRWYKYSYKLFKQKNAAIPDNK